MSFVKRQHYVPRFYLANFSENEQVFGFDKVTRKSFKTNIINVAAEHGFYDFTEEAMKRIQTELGEEVHLQFLEMELGRMESFFRPFIQNIISRVAILSESSLAAMDVLDDESKFRLCEYIARQYLRTRDTREKIKEIWSKVGGEQLKRRVSLTPAGRNIDWTDLDVTCDFTRDQELALQADELFGGPLMHRIADALWSHIWVIGYNESKLPVYTSDNPVVLKPHLKVPVTGIGFDNPGVEIAFPISNNLIILIFERSYHQGVMSSFENKIIRLSEGNIINKNSLQVFQSYRQVYAKYETFDLARLVCAENPKVTRTDSTRIELIHTRNPFRGKI